MIATRLVVVLCLAHAAGWTATPPTWRRCSPAPVTPRGTAPLAADVDEADGSSERSVPMDYDALQQERQQDSYRRASPEELADHLPSWAREMMLDPAAVSYTHLTLPTICSV